MSYALANTVARVRDFETRVNSAGVCLFIEPHYLFELTRTIGRYVNYDYVRPGAVRVALSDARILLEDLKQHVADEIANRMPQ